MLSMGATNGLDDGWPKAAFGTPPAHALPPAAPVIPAIACDALQKAMMSCERIDLHRRESRVSTPRKAGYVRSLSLFACASRACGAWGLPGFPGAVFYGSRCSLTALVLRLPSASWGILSWFARWLLGLSGCAFFSPSPSPFSPFAFVGLWGRQAQG